MGRPPESLKTFANRLAEIAPSGDAVQMARLLRASGLLWRPVDQAGERKLAAKDSRNENKDSPESSDVIGIWERKRENDETYFARRMDKLSEWHFWANLGRIDPKRGKQRVVLIGESVARGYLYDPQFTPAMVLEIILQSHFGKDQIEVVDLARTNLDLGVRELAISALMLDPDLVVIFAGNNWGGVTPLPSEPLKIARVDSTLRAQGVAGLKRLAEADLAESASRVVNDVASAYAAKGTPLIWIIPEFNLGGWRDPITNAPHLPEGVNQKWIAKYEDAQRALLEGDLGRAQESAEELVEIDQGVCVAGFYILAECSQRLNNLDAARRYLELARDAVTWEQSRNISPRPSRVTQEVLRRETVKYGNQIVDVPELFKEYLKGQLPGRELFLDYCHLTTEGIQIVMAAAASCVSRALKGVDIPWDVPAKERISPTSKEEAEALFLAAIHNAHWWQSDDSIRYYCSRAVQISPHIAQIMIHYIDVQTRRTTPMLMCKSAEQIAELGSPLMQNYLLRHNYQLLDKRLLGAIAASLKEIGVDIQGRLDRIRREQLSATVEEINLLDTYFCASAGQAQEVMWAMPSRPGEIQYSQADYYKAYWSDSRFLFVGEAGCPMRLSLTGRLPDMTATEGVIWIEINDKCCAELAFDRDWRTWDIPLAGESICDGVNEIVIHWPMPTFPGEKSLDAVMDDMISKKAPTFYCVFGEIHSFTVSGA